MEYELSNLNIIGYADRFTELFLPAVTAPIFKSKTENNAYILPPFRFKSGKVLDCRISSKDEIDYCDERGIIHLFTKEIFEAKPDHELWIDEKFAPHYELSVKVLKSFDDISYEQVRLCEEALRLNRIYCAKEHIQKAFTVNDRDIKIFALAAYVAKCDGNKARVTRLRNVASQRNLETEFNSQFKIYKEKYDIQLKNEIA